MTMLLASALISVMVSACAGKEVRPEEQPPSGEPANGDPLEPFNRAVFQFNDFFDRYALKPAAEAYDKTVPETVDTGIDNFLSNLGDILVMVNEVLQFKPLDAGKTGGRLVLNTTLGLAGFVDVATPVGLKKTNEDFGQTLGVWGVGEGPYLVMPFLGPANVRDGVGRVGTMYASYEIDNELGIDSATERWTLTVLSVLNIRQDLLGLDDIMEQSGADPYIFMRESYLQRRRAQVNDSGKAPAPADLSDEEEDAIFGDDF
ncbi:MAG: MlaA family lipoprotein [Pseudomonadota bacterium]